MTAVIRGGLVQVSFLHHGRVVAPPLSRRPDLRFPSGSPDRPLHAAAALPDLEPGTQFLTVTTHRIPPDAVAVEIQIAHETSLRCVVPVSGGRAR